MGLWISVLPKFTWHNYYIIVELLFKTINKFIIIKNIYLNCIKEKVIRS